MLGMGIGRITLIAFSIATIFSIGLASTLVYGGNAVIGCIGTGIFDDNFVHATYEPLTLNTPASPSPFDFCSNSGLQLFEFQSSFVQGTGACFDRFCQFQVPNFIDNLDTKIIQIQIDFSGPTPNPPSVVCFDPTGPDGGFLGSNPVLIFQTSTSNTWQIECEPNPDWEDIVFAKDPATSISLVTIWTKSFGDPPIGGTMVPIDTTALLLAGAQSISMWMIPVAIAGVGVSIFVVIRIIKSYN